MSEAPLAGPPLLPYPLALVVCDHVWRDPSTGKMTILGTFSSIGGFDLPVVHPRIAVYAALTDGKGRIRIKLRLIDCDEDGEPVFEQELECQIPDPRMVVELAFIANELKFPSFGEYRLQLYFNDEFAMERRILVLKGKVVEQQPPGEDE